MGASEQAWVSLSLKRSELISCYLAVTLILSGLFLDFLDLKDWDFWYLTMADIRTIGYALLTYTLCPYGFTRVKMFAVVCVFWSVTAFIVNLSPLGPERYGTIISIFFCIFLIWLWRVFFSYKIPEFEFDNDPEWAYYYLIPIHSALGLIQALFFWWRPAYYESRVLIDPSSGCGWLVHNGQFKRVSTRCLVSRIKGVRVSLERRLTPDEISNLEDLVGKPAIPGIRDCRRFLM